MADIYPKTVSPEVKDFLEHYYHHSNASSTHNEHETNDDYFADLFTTDGVYDFMGRKATGKREITALRAALFKEIPHRDHPLVQVFSSGDNDLELMALGKVDYVHHSGTPHSKDWAGLYRLVKTGNALKFKEVKIIADPSQPEGA